MVKIFVEGIADVRFLKCYVQHLYNKSLSDDEIIETGGWNKLSNPEYITLLQKNTDEGNRNIVIFDADKDPEQRRNDLEAIAQKNGVTFDIFLFPDNKTSGDLEELLMRIINPVNKPVEECWNRYEADLQQQTIPWKNPPTPTTPSIKTRVYAYLEALLGESKSQKKLIKEANRRYNDTNHWDLNSPELHALMDFLDNAKI